MPRWILSERAVDLDEIMDDPDCDENGLHRTYRWFERLNPWLARWRTLYRSHLSPMMRSDRPTRILDIGCGGGDLLRLIANEAAREGKAVELTGIDPDERAITYARRQSSTSAIAYRAVHSSELIEEGASFDVVVSNHVLHHLSPESLDTLLNHSAALSTGLVLHNDICRDDLAWLSFLPIGLIARGSFIMTDGLRSIRRAWHPDDLQTRLPAGWASEKLAPFRMLLINRVSS